MNALDLQYITEDQLTLRTSLDGTMSVVDSTETAVMLQIWPIQNIQIKCSLPMPLAKWYNFVNQPLRQHCLGVTCNRKNTSDGAKILHCHQYPIKSYYIPNPIKTLGSERCERATNSIHSWFLRVIVLELITNIFNHNINNVSHELGVINTRLVPLRFQFLLMRPADIYTGHTNIKYCLLGH